MRHNSICYGCEKRTATCYSTCEPYLAEAEARRAETENNHKLRVQCTEVNEVLLSKIKKEAVLTDG